MLYPYLEVVGRTRIMEISLELAPCASNKLYRYHYTVSCEFPTFPNTIDNQLLPLFLTNKIVPPPCTQGLEHESDDLCRLRHFRQYLQLQKYKIFYKTGEFLRKITCFLLQVWRVRIRATILRRLPQREREPGCGLARQTGLHPD